jgi:thiol-disulfide isomerase/thioredoxin
MKRIFLFLISFSIFAYSCSKKDTVKDNNNNIKQPATEKKVETYKPASFKGFYAVKDINNSQKRSEFIDFTWQESGKDVKLSDSKGKVILLNFWATWCPPCKKELPALSAISNELNSKNFKLIGISVDENPQILESFLESNSLSFIILHQPVGLLERYMAVAGGTQNVIPQSFIIDKNGKVVEHIIGGRDKQGFLELIKKYM